MNAQTENQAGGLENSGGGIPGYEHLRTIGIVLVVLGVLALVAPVLAGVTVSIVIGILFLVTGLSKGVRVFRTESWKDHWEDLLLAALAVLAGCVMVARPLVGLTAITVALVVYFLASGLLQIAWWWRVRRFPGAIWVFVAGAATVLLAALIGFGWPLSGIWAVGTLVGIHLVLSGGSLIALASASAD